MVNQPTTDMTELSTSARLRQAEHDRDLAQAELSSATTELDRLRRYVATLERELSKADAALPVFDQEYP